MGTPITGHAPKQPKVSSDDSYPFAISLFPPFEDLVDIVEDCFYTAAGAGQKGDHGVDLSPLSAERLQDASDQDCSVSLNWDNSDLWELLGLHELSSSPCSGHLAFSFGSIVDSVSLVRTKKPPVFAPKNPNLYLFFPSPPAPFFY